MVVQFIKNLLKSKNFVSMQMKWAKELLSWILFRQESKEMNNVCFNLIEWFPQN